MYHSCCIPQFSVNIEVGTGSNVWHSTLFSLLSTSDYWFHGVGNNYTSVFNIDDSSKKLRLRRDSNPQPLGLRLRNTCETAENVFVFKLRQVILYRSPSLSLACSYLLKVVSINMSLHVPLYYPGSCRITCSHFKILLVLLYFIIITI